VQYGYDIIRAVVNDTRNAVQSKVSGLSTIWMPRKLQRMADAGPGIDSSTKVSFAPAR